MKDKKKIAKMREGGLVLVEIMKELIDMVNPGISTLEIDGAAERMCGEKAVKPAFKGYQGFPATICVGPNDTVVHGIPDDRTLEEGDIISIDMGIIFDDVYLDMARTVGVGDISADARDFVNTVRTALEKACAAAKVGNTVGDIGYQIQSVVEEAGYSVVREMVGHGVGYELHEPPSIPGYGSPGEGEKLYDGQTIAIEAIINQGSPRIEISREDGWTSTTKDGMLSALFENTVLVSEESEILTPLELQE
jgi:methionyl aminopeptidase